MDPLVKILSVKDSPGFDINTLQPLRDKVVSYMVGTHGPFFLRYHLADYNDTRVQADIQKEVDTLRAINAIIAALNFLYQVILAVLQFLYAALVAVANFVSKAAQLVGRALTHLFRDLIPKFFNALWKDYLDLKAKLGPIIQRVIDVIKKIRDWYNVHILAPMLRTINMIQHIRQFLVVFRLLGFKWAAKLDNQLAGLEQRIAKNTLVIQSYINFALDVLELAIDPSLILRKNFLLASLLSALGAIKRVVFFGANRTPSTDESKQMKQDSGSLAPGAHLLESGFASSATYAPTVQRILPCIDAAHSFYGVGA